MADRLLKQGDTVRLTATLRGADGPADLSGADVRFVMRTLRGETLVAEGEAENLQVGDGTDGTLGFVGYDWAAGETDEPGGYRAEWEVTYSDGSVQTFPSGTYNYIGILADNDGGS